MVSLYKGIFGENPKEEQKKWTEDDERRICEKLAIPMTEEEVSMRVLTKSKNIVYVKKSVLFEKLSSVFGEGSWSIKYTLPTFYQNEYNKSINRWDVCCILEAHLHIKIKDKEWNFYGILKN